MCVGRSGPEIFSFRQHGERIHAFRAQLGLRYVRKHRARRDLGQIGDRAGSAAACGRHRHDADRLRLQNCRRAVPSLGTRRLSGRAGSDRGVHRFGIKGRLVRRARKNRAGRLWPDAWQRRVARDGRRVGRRSSPCWRRCRFWSATSSRSRRKMFAGCSPILPSRTPATLCSDWSPEAGKDFRPRFFTLRFTQSRWSARSASLRSYAAKPAATI